MIYGTVAFGQARNGSLAITFSGDLILHFSLETFLLVLSFNDLSPMSAPIDTQIYSTCTSTFDITQHNCKLTLLFQQLCTVSQRIKFKYTHVYSETKTVQFREGKRIAIKQLYNV